jgi:hypothetical protein
MTRRNRKKYGDKITQEVTGADGAPLVGTPQINAMSADEWVAWVNRDKS